MLVCKRCGYVAADDSAYWDVEEELIRDTDGVPCGECSTTHCPECGSDEVDYAAECDICGEYHDEDKLVMVDIECAPTDEDIDDEEEWGEDTLKVCTDCCDNYFAGGRNIIFDLRKVPAKYLPEVGEDFKVGKFSGKCIYAEVNAKRDIANFLMHIEEDE